MGIVLALAWTPRRPGPRLQDLKGKNGVQRSRLSVGSLAFKLKFVPENRAPSKKGTAPGRRPEHKKRLRVYLT